MKKTDNFFIANTKLVLVLAIFYTVFEIIHFSKLWFFIDLQNMPWPEHVGGLYVIDWVIVILYMTFIAWYTKNLISRNVPWKKIFLLHFLFSILISFIIRIALESYELWMNNMDLQTLTLEKLLLNFLANIDTNFLIYFAMVFIIYSYYYQEESVRNQAQKSLLERQLLDSRIRMLTSQLQPHFLFNTLNSISSLVQIDQKKAQDTIADLSDFLRQILYHGDSNFISVKKELEILEKYLNLLKTRFWDQLHIEEKIDPALHEKKIPALILQPLVENAIKHGFSSKNPVLQIVISTCADKDFMYFSVSNSGNPLENPETIYVRGIGLSNLRERLETIYSNDAQLSVENKKEGGVICTIKIPKN